MRKQPFFKTYYSSSLMQFCSDILSLSGRKAMIWNRWWLFNHWMIKVWPFVLYKCCSINSMGPVRCNIPSLSVVKLNISLWCHNLKMLEFFFLLLPGIFRICWSFEYWARVSLWTRTQKVLQKPKLTFNPFSVKTRSHVKMLFLEKRDCYCHYFSFATLVNYAGFFGAKL